MGGGAWTIRLSTISIAIRYEISSSFLTTPMPRQSGSISPDYSRPAGAAGTERAKVTRSVSAAKDGSDNNFRFLDFDTRFVA